MSDLWSDRIDLTDLEAVIDEHGGLHVAYNLHEDLLCVKEKAKADLQEKLKVAFVTGYELGHNDTVESQYTDAEDRYEDSKDDIIELIKQRMSR